MWRIALRICDALFAVLTGLLMAMAEISPAGAHSNLSAWLVWAGHHHAPNWLLGKNIDQTVFAGGALLLVIYAVVFLASFYEPRRKGNLTAPRRGWIPIDKAPFVIRRHPEFAHDAEGPDPAFLPLRFMDHYLSSGSIDLPPPRGMTFNPGVPSMRMTDGADLIYCGIDWDKEAFCWRWGQVGRQRGFGFDRRPWEMETFPLESFLSEEGANTLRAKASSVWNLMQHPISTFLSEGRLVVWARIGVATAPFSVIPADTWQHYKIADWPTGRAETAKGEILYSVHIEVVRKRVSRVADGFRSLRSLLARLTGTTPESPHA